MEEEKKQEEYDVVDNNSKSNENIRNDSYFDGSLIELIGYHILSFLISAFTLGFGKPWADCMLIKYKVDHTVLNGKRLVFEGKGSSYFVQKFKWLVFTIITLGIYSFWVPINKLKWQISHIHFQDEEYVEGDNFFDGNLLGLVGINILCMFLNVISFGLLYPVVHCLKMKWICKHTIINRKRLIFKGSALSFFLNNLLWYVLTIITLGIFGLWLGILRMKWQVKNTSIRLKDEVEKSSLVEIIIVIVSAVISLFVVVALISFISNYNVDISNNIETVNEMKNTYVLAERELVGKTFTDDEESLLLDVKRQDEIMSKLNLSSLNNFVASGGKVEVVMTGFSVYSYDFTIKLKKNGLTCTTDVNTDEYIYEDDIMKCRSFESIVGGIKNSFGSFGKVNQDSNSMNTDENSNITTGNINGMYIEYPLYK